MTEPTRDEVNPFIPDMKKLHTCHYCGEFDALVECSGIYHCVNLVCTGPGSAWFRATCKSFTEHDDGRHSVDHDEWLVRAKVYAMDNPQYRVNEAATAKEGSDT